MCPIETWQQVFMTQLKFSVKLQIWKDRSTACLQGDSHFLLTAEVNDISLF